jgi:hypothetical protein
LLVKSRRRRVSRTSGAVWIQIRGPGPPWPQRRYKDLDLQRRDYERSRTNLATDPVTPTLAIAGNLISRPPIGVLDITACRRQRPSLCDSFRITTAYNHDIGRIEMKPRSEPGRSTINVIV